MSKVELGHTSTCHFYKLSPNKSRSQRETDNSFELTQTVKSRCLVSAFPTHPKAQAHQQRVLSLPTNSKRKDFSPRITKSLPREETEMFGLGTCLDWKWE